MIEDRIDFYEQSYRSADGEKYGRWRALGAATKADHVVQLARTVGLVTPVTIAEVGCGDGAVLDELAMRGFGEVRDGYELSGAAATLAAERSGVTAVHVFDGSSLAVPDESYDLVIASHVLEHVSSPVELLRELRRVGRWVVVEVPLEANLSARRPAARAASVAAGHIQRFSRRGFRELVASAGLEIRAELSDPLPLAVHLFERSTLPAKARAYVKWATRATIARVPRVAERLLTLHYAVAATRAGG